MHTFKGESCTIHYNSDLSGDLRIIVGGTDNAVAASDITNFVVKHITDEIIYKLEATGVDTSGVMITSLDDIITCLYTIECIHQATNLSPIDNSNDDDNFPDN